MYETGKVKASVETTTPSKKFRVIPESPQPTAKTEYELKSHMVRLKEEWKNMPQQGCRPHQYVAEGSNSVQR